MAAEVTGTLKEEEVVVVKEGASVIGLAETTMVEVEAKAAGVATVEMGEGEAGAAEEAKEA